MCSLHGPCWGPSGPGAALVLFTFPSSLHTQGLCTCPASSVLRDTPTGPSLPCGIEMTVLPGGQLHRGRSLFCFVFQAACPRST